MLDDASKYECLDVTGLEGFITGDIMPKRDLRNDGSWRAMKYEDLLFLNESYLERKRAIGLGPSSKVKPPGRMLSASRFRDATYIDLRYIHDADGYEFNQRGNYIGDDIDLDGFGIVELDADATFDNCGMLMGSSPGELSRPSYGEPPKADHVRQAYYDLRYFKRTFRLVSSQDFADNSWQNIRVGEDGGQTVSSSGSGTGIGEIYSTGMATRLGSFNRRYSFTFHDLPEIPWSSACWWAFIVDVSHGIRVGEIGDSETVATTRRFMLFQPCGGSPSAPDIAAVASQTIAEAGCTYSPAPYYSENESVSATVKEIGLVADHDFPSDFSSLGWNWEPTGG